MYSSGLRVYLLDNYNLLDFIVLSLYLASYMLRFLVDRWIKQADRHYNGTERAREALISRNYNEYDLIQHQIFYDSSDSSQSYFMKARTSLIQCNVTSGTSVGLELRMAAPRVLIVWRYGIKRGGVSRPHWEEVWAG